MIDEDKLDDDLELDDLGDDDFEESWDDEDTEESADEEDLSAAITSQSAPGNKTFLQRHFYAIVGAVLLIFGGVAFLGLSGGQKSQAPQDMPAELADIDELQTDLPPMPTPMTGMETSDQTAQIPGLPLEDPAPATDLAPVSDLALTPMPDFSGNSDIELTDLPDLTADLNQGARGAVTETLPTEDMLSEDALLAEPPITPEPVALPILNNDAANTEVETEAADKANAARTEIESLTKTVEELQNKLETMAQEKSAALAAAQTAEKPAKTPAKNKATKTSTKPKAAKTVQKTTPKPRTTPQWTLRSAQSGKAVLAPKGSNELFRAAVGDTVPGLGRITSIQLENGKWVVRGSQGSASQ